MTEMAEKTVFVSYASADTELVREIVAGLEARGVRCWFAERDIPVSDDFGDRIMAAIAESDATVVIVSESSIKSRHVRREVNFADEQGHQFYPVRLLNILISRELAYFTKVGHSIDLHEENHETAMDRLAQAIRSGRELERRRTRRERLRGRVLALGLVALILLAAGISLWQLRTMEDRLGNLEARNDSDTRYSQAGFSFWRDTGDEGFRLGNLQRTEAQLYGIPWQTEAIELAAYDDTGDTLHQIAAAKGVPMRRDQSQTVAFDFLGEVENPLTCMIFAGTDSEGEVKRFAAIRHQVQVEFDPEARVEEIDEATSCNDYLGVSSTDFLARLDTAQATRKVEQRTPFAVVSGVVGTANFPPSIKFDVFGGWDLDRRVPETTSQARVFLGDGEKWNPVLEGFLAANGFIREMNIARPVSETHLRACVSQPLDDERWVVSDVVFRRDARTVQGWRRLTENGASEAIVRGVDPCVGIVSEQSQPVTEISHLERMIGPGTAEIGFSHGDRDRALQAISAGNAQAYGPSVAGIQLGMALEDAIARATSLLPEAMLLDTTVSPYKGSNFTKVRSLAFVDVERRLSLTLTTHDNREVVAGAWWHQSPDALPIPIDNAAAVLRRRLGPDRGNQRKEISTRKELVWLDPSVGTCNYGPVPFSTHKFETPNRARFREYVDLVTAQGASHLQSCGVALIAVLKSDRRNSAQTVALSDFDAFNRIGGKE